MRSLALLALAQATSLATAAELSITEAIAYAKANNGQFAAAVHQADIARSSVRISQAAFLPNLLPEYRYTDTYSGGFGGLGSSSRNSVTLGANWLLLDGGQRSFALSRAQRLADAASLSATDTLKLTIFGVIQRFYETIRAQELLRVADAQVARAAQTLDVTKRQVEVGAAPRKDVLQAEADWLNATVSQIAARNAISVSSADLKAVLGWKERELPTLVAPEQEPERFEELTLEQAIQQGLERRPDLLEARKRLDADRFSLLAAQRQASVDWTLSLNYSKAYEPNEAENRNLTVLVSFPLFDGGVSREIVRQNELSIRANQRLLEQQVLNAMSEIESAFLGHKANLERLTASDAALKAARINFQAATESQSEGVASILDVTSAQVSLVTAETNYVQSLYDTYISENELRLAIGAKLPGE